MGRSPYVLVDSINYLKPDHAGMVVVSGSHGGLYCGNRCLTGQVRGVVFNDAGIGKENAGIASLAQCDAYSLPVAVIDHRSARIGDARDMVQRGVVSRCNETAAGLGVKPSMECIRAAALFNLASPRFCQVGEVLEYRHEIIFTGDDGKQLPPVVCIDSASLIAAADAGRVVITGSHGGLIGGDPAKAVNVQAGFLAFNDAGIGIDQAGAGRLAPLDEREIPAVLVDCATARIGDARSTLDDGIISMSNRAAESNGFAPGAALKPALIRFLKERAE